MVIASALLALLVAGCMGMGGEQTSNVATIDLADTTPAAVNAPVTAAAADETTTGVVAAAEALLATLDESQRTKALFAFDNDEQRANWSNLPTGIYQRAGLRMGDLSQEQRDAVYTVLAATLSPEGYQRVVD
jgi:ABC-type Fe3+-hydroxamate transport system substrate-binding protein